MSDASYTIKIAEDVTYLMKQRVEEILRAFPIPPGLEKFNSKAEAAKHYAAMSPENKAEMLQRYRNTYGEQGTARLAEDLLGGKTDGS